MPKAKLIRSCTLPYHVTARANNREWFYLPMSTIWEVMIEKLTKVIWSYGIEVQCFVLMSNHFHLLLRTPQGNIDRAMNYFLREVSKEMNRRSGRINHAFGGPYKSNLIESPFHFSLVFKYVVRNPVKAKICETVQSYPYSTYALSLADKRPLILSSVPYEPLTILAKAIAEQLAWFNEAFHSEADDCLKRGLRRARFEISPHPRSRRIPVGLKREENTP